jgi:hypothetical protein
MPFFVACHSVGSAALLHFICVSAATDCRCVMDDNENEQCETCGEEHCPRSTCTVIPSITWGQFKLEERTRLEQSSVSFVT